MVRAGTPHGEDLRVISFRKASRPSDHLTRSGGCASSRKNGELSKAALVTKHPPNSNVCCCEVVADPRGNKHCSCMRERVLGLRGNPQALNLFGIIGYLQKHPGVELHVAAGPQ